jgi:DNA-directed RNA polymerase subunit L
MNIQNIIIKDYSIDYSKSKYAKLIEKNKHMLPKLKKQSIQFQLINSNEAFANAIRRVFNDELQIKTLKASIFDIHTDDKYILPDNIIERIMLIPILQTIDNNSKFSIKMVNNTNDIINIYSRDIINSNKNDKNIYFNDNILICSLKPNKMLTINNIFVDSDYGFNNHIYTLGSFQFKAINTDFNIPSLNNNITDFEIELINNCNIEIQDMINMIYDNLYLRLKTIQNSINNYNMDVNSSDINKIMNELFILVNNDIYEIHINNEYHTIGNLITKYIYNIDPSIELINYTLEHPLRHKIIINIKHPNYKQIINDAINNIIKDLDIFHNILNKK